MNNPVTGETFPDDPLAATQKPSVTCAGDDLRGQNLDAMEQWARQARNSVLEIPTRLLKGLSNTPLALSSAWISCHSW